MSGQFLTLAMFLLCRSHPWFTFFPFWQLCIVKGCCCGNDNEEDDDDEGDAEGDEDGDEGDDDEGDDGDSTEKQVSFRGRAN